MRAPLVVNTKDGTVWTRREGMRGGEALYAPEKCGQCPQFVMATLTALAEHGIVGSADVLPVPVGPGPLALSGPICSQAEARAAGLDIAPSVEELDAMASTIVAAGDPLSAEVSLAQAVPLLGAAVTGLRARVAELERQLATKDRPVDEDPIAFALTNRAVVPAGFCRNESPYGRRCDLSAGHVGDHAMADGAGGHFGWPASTEDDMTPKVRQLEALIAAEREQAGGAS